MFTFWSDRSGLSSYHSLMIADGDSLIEDLRRGRIIANPPRGTLQGVALAVPLIAFSELVGVLMLGEREVRQDYNADDREALRDLADQAALAIRVARLQAELVTAERFSTLGAAAGAIVHDIKNQMAVAGGYAGLLSRPDLRPEQRKRFGDALVRSIDGFSLMATEILDMARGESHVKIEPSRVSQLIDSVQPILNRLCEQSGIELVLQLDYMGELPLDVPRMQRVLFNLCDNAHDALLTVDPQGGRRITLSNGVQEGAVVFRVSDNGPGVPEHIRDTLFEPFTSFNKLGGTGLGLAIARRVVEAHGGYIALDSTTQDGASFVLSLPLAPAAQPHAATHA